MRIPILALTMAAAAVVAVPTTATAAAPTANADSAQTEAGIAKTINVMANDSNPDSGESLSVAVKTQGAHGTVTCGTPAGACVYTPSAGWSGTDSFTYTLSDGGTTPETATGTVTVKTVKVQSISISSKPGSIAYSYNKDTGALVGQAAVLTGVVRQSSTVVLPNVEVELWYLPFGAENFTKLAGPFTSRSDGSVSFTDTQRTSKTVYQWRSASKTSALEGVAVTPTLTATFSPRKTQAVGQPFTVSGKSAPATAGAQVLLQRRGSTGAWATVLTTTLNSDSTYIFPSITPTTSVSDLYRVFVPAANGRQQVVTTQNTVKAYNARIQDVETNNADEFVTIKNNGVVPINLRDWRLSQGETNIDLPRLRVPVDGIVRIHSGKGVNTVRDFYLRRTDATVWPRSGSITLKDNANPRVQMGAPFTF